MGKGVDDKDANGRMVKRGWLGGKSTASRYLFYTSGFFWGEMAHMYFLKTWLGRREPLETD